MKAGVAGEALGGPPPPLFLIAVVPAAARFDAVLKQGTGAARNALIPPPDMVNSIRGI
jgi:hypothetical protein